MPTTDINLNLSYVESIVAGTNITVDDTDPQNPIVSASGGSGITGVGTVDYIPKVLTVSSGNIVTVGNSVFQDTTDIASAIKTGVNKGVQFAVINGTFAGVMRVLSLSADNGRVSVGSETGTVRIGMAATPNNAYFGTCLNNDFVAFDSYIRSDENAELYIMSAGIPLTSVGVLTVAADGKIGVASAGGGTTTNPLTIGTGLSGTSFDGSAAVTIEIDSTVATLTGSQVLTNKTLTSPVIGAIVGLNGQIAHTTTAQASGAIIDYLFTPSNHTGQTASTNSPVFRIAASTKTFATGAITNAYGTHIESTTLAFAASSTVTNSYGLYVEANTLGTNAVFTNTYGIGTNGFLRIGVGATTQGTIIRNDTTANYAAIYNGNVTPSNTNFGIKYSGTTTFVNGATGGSLFLTYNAGSVVSISSATTFGFADGVNISTGTTNGSKIGAATTHKLALWNKTPIVQPTTAITGATLVSNAGTTITSTDTFGGYTLQQIAAALVNFGLLA